MGLLEDLSAAFVAFVVEVDDGSEAKGVWTVSTAMYRNCLQWLPAEGLREAELVAVARTPTDLNGMVRWGYVGVEGGLVRATRRGARALEGWVGVPGEVEGRRVERFGDLRAALVPLVEKLDPGLPDTMPIVRHGWATRRDGEPEREPGPVAVADLGLDSLLARPLTAFALEYEASGKLSLALSANLLAVLGAEPIPIRDLPDLTGIFRAQIDNAVGYLERAGLAEVAPIEGAKRGKSVAPTARGRKAKGAAAAKLAALEATWDERHGATVARVREALAPVAAGGGPDSPLVTGAVHPPGSWRAEAKPLARLPRFPLVTHRGGFPDGA
jgi:DNA-binding MarR family transcriptional regulator